MVADADGTNVVQLTPETLGCVRVELRAGWPIAPGVAQIDGE